MRQPIWIELPDTLAIHQRLLVLHGGAPGIRDTGLLQSALARPQQHFAYRETNDIVELAGIYTRGIVQNRPFLDGNKRTAYVVGVLFAELNGYRFDATEEEAAQMVLALAAGTIKAADYLLFLRANSKRKHR